MQLLFAHLSNNTPSSVKCKNTHVHLYTMTEWNIQFYQLTYNNYYIPPSLPLSPLTLPLSISLSSLYFSLSHHHRTVEYLDLEQGKWVAVENMLSRRSTLGVAVFNGELYAVGGFDGTTGLDTVEKYNPGRLCVCVCVCVF